MTSEKKTTVCIEWSEIVNIVKLIGIFSKSSIDHDVAKPLLEQLNGGNTVANRLYKTRGKTSLIIDDLTIHLYTKLQYFHDFMIINDTKWILNTQLELLSSC